MEKPATDIYTFESGKPITFIGIAFSTKIGGHPPILMT